MDGLSGSSGPTRVLVVDDIPETLDHLCRMIAKTPGFAVAGTAADGVEAIAQVARLEPDVVLMDVIMPKLRGIEAMARLVRERPGLPIVVMSILGGADDLRRARDAGARAYLVKPFSADELLEAFRGPGISIDVEATREPAATPPSPPSPSTSTQVPASFEVSAEQGTVDGESCATAIALVFAMRMRAALIGATIVVSVGQHPSPGDDAFLTNLTYWANGYDRSQIPSDLRLDATAMKDRRDYLSSFRAALGLGLDRPRDLGAIVRELSAGATQASNDDSVFRWIDELTALQSRNLTSEDELQATRRRDVERGVFPRWLLPPVRDGSRLERWTVSRDFPMDCIEIASGYLAVVSDRKTGRQLFRSECATRAEAEAGAWEFALLRSVIANRPEYRELNGTVSRTERSSPPLGADGAMRLRRLADRDDRLQRSNMLGDFTDDRGWQAALDGDAEYFLSSLRTPPFRGSLGPF